MYLKDDVARIEARRFGRCSDLRVPRLEGGFDRRDPISAGTPVKVVSIVPTTEGDCTFACVTVALPTVDGEYVVPLNLLGTERPITPSAREIEQRAQARADGEIQADRCSAEHVEQLRAALNVATRVVDGMSRSRFSNEMLAIAAHRLVVATPDGVPYELDPGMSGEFDVVALSSFGKPSIYAVDGQGYPIAIESRYGDALGQVFMGKLGYDGRAIQVNTSERVQIAIKGQGCMLLLVIQRF